MNSLQLQLLELLQMAETPLYSAYRWLSRQVGREMSLEAFLGLLDSWLKEDSIRLWKIDPSTKEKQQWVEAPMDLARQYADADELDDSYDPLGLSLTVGATADLNAHVQWEADLDFEGGYFVISADPDALNEATLQLKKLLPDIELREQVQIRDNGRIVVRGTIINVI